MKNITKKYWIRLSLVLSVLLAISLIYIGARYKITNAVDVCAPRPVDRVGLFSLECARSDQADENMNDDAVAEDPTEGDVEIEDPVKDNDAEPEADADGPESEEAEELETVLYSYQLGAVPLGDESPLGAVYFPAGFGPMLFNIPFQGHVIVAVGKVTVNDKKYTADPDEINLIYDLCDDSDGCEIEVDGYKPGNISVTVMFSGSEKPRSTATGALVHSWLAPNCGGNGCNFANFYDLKDADNDATYDRPADGATPATINPTSMEITVEFEVVGLEPDTTVLPGEVGHITRPTVSEDAEEMFFSASEGGHTIVICEDGCVIHGRDVSSDQVVWVIGQNTDGLTPADLNWTFKITGADQDDVAILMLYALETDPEPYLRIMAEQLLGDDVEDFDVMKIKYSAVVEDFIFILENVNKVIEDFFNN